jgi:FixJ family two-component response regulator
MRASIYIVHVDDGLLRAIAGLLASEGYRVQSAGTIGALLGDLRTAERPAVLLVDEAHAGPTWREELEEVPEDVPRVLLTFDPRGTFPPGVTPVGKPFHARELLETLSRNVAARAPRPP